MQTIIKYNDIDTQVLSNQKAIIECKNKELIDNIEIEVIPTFYDKRVTIVNTSEITE